MSNDVRLRFEGVYKQFRRGEQSRSLREAVPALWRRLRGLEPREDADGEAFYSLQDVNFEVRAGECVGVIGNNGAGKSTLLKCASRILRPNRGEIEVKGRVSALIEVGAGFHPDLTGRENVFLNGAILGMKRREIADRFDAIVDFSGMARFIDTPVKRYSSGMYARLGFSVAAYMDPDVLLIDEVLSVGDIAFARKCERKIQEIVNGNTTVLFVSHNLAAVRMICERVIVLRAGEAVFDGPTVPAIHSYHEMLSQEENSGQAHPAVRSLRFTLGDDGNPGTLQIEAGGLVTLDAELVADDYITEASVGFSVQDERGQELFEARLEDLGEEPVDLPPGGVLRARFRFSANLVPGIYWIGSTIRGRTADVAMSEPNMLESTPNRMQLDVLGHAEGRGSVNVFPHCETYHESHHRSVIAECVR